MQNTPQFISFDNNRVIVNVNRISACYPCDEDDGKDLKDHWELVYATSDGGECCSVYITKEEYESLYRKLAPFFVS